MLLRSKLFQFLFTAVICYSAEQMQQAENKGECKSYCHSAGYDVGLILKDESCYCAEKQNWEHIHEKTLTLPKRRKTNTSLLPETKNND